MPVVKYVPDSRVKPESAYLREFARNVTSQLGEDGIIEKIFAIIGPANRCCCEFGAWDGIHFSNTWNLIARQRWRGLLIEADRDRFRELQGNYAGRDDVRLVQAMVEVDGERSLDAILAAAKLPIDFDLLSIDVDGMDWHIWNTLLGHRPRVVVIEFNQSVPNDVIFIQDPDPAVNQGASLLAMIDLAKAKSYELVATTTCNAFFVDRELFPQFKISDNSIDAMHDLRGSETKIFQLYDGTLMLAGHQQLIWHGIPIDSEKIQILPKEARVFRK